MPDLQTHWRNSRAAGAVLAPPPAQFEVIGERIIQFLGPVRASIFASEPFGRARSAGAQWSPAIVTEEPAT
jgi:hypothetical protein